MDHIAQWLDRIVARLTEAGLLVQRLLIAAVAVVFFLPGQASLPVTDRDEARFAQASLQMVESGDPVDIRFQDEPRLKKPVGIYWLQAGAMLLSGQGAEASVFVQRLPSLLGAVVAVVLVHVAGVPLIGAAGGVAVPFLAFGPALLVGVAAAAITGDAAVAAWPALLALPGPAVLAVVAFGAVRLALPGALPVALALLGGLTASAVIASLARMPQLWPSQEVARIMQAERPAGCAAVTLGAVGYSEPSLIRLTSRSTRFADADTAVGLLMQGCALVAVEDRAGVAFSSALPAGAARQVGRVEGVAIGAGRSVGLTIYAAGPKP